MDIHLRDCLHMLLVLVCRLNNRYDISHELVVTPEAEDPAAYIATEIPVHVVEYIEKRFAELGESASCWSSYCRVSASYAAMAAVAFCVCILASVPGDSSCSQCYYPL
jgi:hypothetical protein